MCQFGVVATIEEKRRNLVLLASVPESGLVASAKEGSIDAFSRLVELYEVNVKSVLALRMRNASEVDDLAQEAFLVAYRKIEDFDSSKEFGPWVRGIAINLLRNHNRKHQPLAVGGVAELESLVDAQIENTYSNDNEADAYLALQSCMESLSNKQRILVDEHYIDGFTVKELTDRYGAKHSTITMRLHRVRDALKHCVNARLGLSER